MKLSELNGCLPKRTRAGRPSPRRLAKVVMVLAIGLVFLYSPGGAVSRAAPAGQPAAGAGGQGDQGANKGENQIEEFDIVGKIYKPEVFVFLGRKALNLSWDLDDPRFKRSFLDAVINAVWGPPF
jgi:hypothetical protein